MYSILVINTGSTSTKVALFAEDARQWEENIVHFQEQLAHCGSMLEQYPLRRQALEETLQRRGVQLRQLSAVAARGGTFGCAQGGAYRIEERLLEACRNPVTSHPSNLSALLAYDIAQQAGCEGYIYDAVCTNEVKKIARYTGLKDVWRRPFSHVLNTRAVARQIAQKMGRQYEQLVVIAAHLGGGISVNIHDHGRIVDLVCDDEGPMSPERAGGMNGKSYVDLCFSGSYTKEGMMRRLKGRGGLIDHLGTSDLREVEQRILQGDAQAAEVLAAMGYQISKAIASLAAVAAGRVDAIALTGGGAYCGMLVEPIRERVSFLAPVYVFPGGREMEALAAGVLRVLRGEESARIYEQ